MVSNAQIWTLLGIITAMLGLIVTLGLAQFAGLRALMEARFDAVDVRFDGVDRRLDGVDRRLDGLDRDVQALTNRVFRTDL